PMSRRPPVTGFGDADIDADATPLPGRFPSMARAKHAHVSIEDYALLGDRHTAALVSREGSVDWWCVPRFDSGACFAALLGDHTNGRFLLAPADHSEITRSYREDTLVLETVHSTSSGKVRVIDFLARDHVRPVLVRIV